MKKFNSIFIGLTCSLFFLSCNNSDSNDKKLAQNTINEIKSYFNSKFESNYNLQESETDSLIELSYTSKEATDDILGSNILISIPKINTTNGPEGSNSIVFGDLNADQKNDIVICVSSEGENGSAVLPDPNKIFVFLNSNNEYKLSCVTDADILNGGNPGFYYPVEIKDGSLLGMSFLWGKGDSESNPTSIYTSVSKFADNKLLFINKTFVKKGKKAWD